MDEALWQDVVILAVAIRKRAPLIFMLFLAKQPTVIGA